ncbi:MAG: hypothetical protein NTW60_00180, partial [Candidatus Wolfebacteria bacterium]|nr:hypothetical protein [Candidatus Wolfebacteria bacterium]
MILTAHMLTGGAIGRLVPQNPLLAFILGFLSHFILDAIPHSEYELKSLIRNKENHEAQDMVLGKNFARDIFVIGLDFFLGIFLCLVIFKNGVGIFDPSLSMLSGALGGALPDALQFLYFKIRKEPFTTLQKFHIRIQNNLGSKHWAGWTTQVGVIVITILVSKIIK